MHSSLPFCRNSLLLRRDHSSEWRPATAQANGTGLFLFVVGVTVLPATSLGCRGLSARVARFNPRLHLLGMVAQDSRRRWLARLDHPRPDGPLAATKWSRGCAPAPHSRPHRMRSATGSWRAGKLVPTNCLLCVFPPRCDSSVEVTH